MFVVRDPSGERAELRRRDTAGVGGRGGGKGGAACRVGLQRCRGPDGSRRWCGCGAGVRVVVVLCCCCRGRRGPGRKAETRWTAQGVGAYAPGGDREPHTETGGRTRGGGKCAGTRAARGYNTMEGQRWTEGNRRQPGGGNMRRPAPRTPLPPCGSCHVEPVPGPTRAHPILYHQVSCQPSLAFPRVPSCTQHIASQTCMRAYINTTPAQQRPPWCW